MGRIRPGGGGYFGDLPPGVWGGHNLRETKRYLYFILSLLAAQSGDDPRNRRVVSTGIATLGDNTVSIREEEHAR